MALPWMYMIRSAIVAESRFQSRRETLDHLHNLNMEPKIKKACYPFFFSFLPFFPFLKSLCKMQNQQTFNLETKQTNKL